VPHKKRENLDSDPRRRSILFDVVTSLSVVHCDFKYSKASAKKKILTVLRKQKRDCPIRYGVNCQRSSYQI
jgi:hypothetical protein